MNRSYRVASLATIGTLALAIAACDRDDREPDTVVYDTNTTVVNNDADECPRADGQPCK